MSSVIQNTVDPMTRISIGHSMRCASTSRMKNATLATGRMAMNELNSIDWFMESSAGTNTRSMTGST